MQLLEHFKAFSLHPKNATELRGLILQLAVQGKLTAKWRRENPNVEPASILLQRIQKEKAQLVKEKKVKKEKPLPAITKDEISHELPDSWVWCRMLDFCYLITDGAHHTPKYVDSGIPFLSVKNLSKGTLDFSNTKFIEPNTHRDLIKRCNPEYEDILLTKIGTTGIAKVIDVKRDFSIFVSVALLKISRTVVFPEFVEHCINSPLVKRQSSEGTEGVGNKNLVLRKIKAFIVPMPPLKEQKAIVAVINQLFAEVDQLVNLTKQRIHLKSDFVISALRQLTTGDTQKEWAFLQPYFSTFFTEKPNIKKLRESILQLAVQGKLTKSWRSENPNTENASFLLERIKTEKEALVKAKIIKKEKPLPIITDDEIPYDLPEGWVWCRLGNYVHYGALAKYENKDASEGTWVLELEDIEKDSSRLLKKVRFAERDFKSTKSVFKTSDVVYGKLRPYLNKVIVADEDGVCTTEMIPIKSFSNSNSEYLRWFMKHPGFIEYANSSTHGMRMPRMGTDVAKNAIISVPPSEEQKIIVQKVNALMHQCDELEQQIKTSKAAQEYWMKSALREVFSPRETKDELLSALLPELDSLNKVANLQQAMIVQKTELGLGSGRGKVYLQKTSANLKNIKKVAIAYNFEKSHHGEFSWQLSEDLDKNPYLLKVTTDYGEIYNVKPERQQEVLMALNSPDYFSFVEAVNELLEVYKNKLINGATDRIELLNTVCKAIKDTQSTIGNTIYGYMQEWEIKQKDFKTKADKFTQNETFAMIQLVTQLGWDKELVSHG